MKFLFLVWTASTMLTSAFPTVGFQKISVPDPQGRPLSVVIWFPSVGRAVSVQVGPFQQMVVPEGVISGQRLPVVLISHGTGGSAASHYDTALALAGAGFFVVALTHTGDNYLDQSYAGNQKDLTDRPRQVKIVLNYMLTTWPERDRLDAARVGMFGFSLGGFTTLVEAGGTPDISRIRELCTQRPAAPECRFIKERNGDQLRPAVQTPVWSHDQRVKAAVLVAPAVSYVFGPGSLRDVKIPIQLWRGANDDQVPDEWNTALVRKELPMPPQEHVVPGAGHYAFLPPCSEALAQQTPQICTDIPSFDRSAFHRDFNSEIVAFFKKTLAA